MKNKLLIIFAIFLSFNCYSQIIFEKGYYINNLDEKIECLIKNVQWYNNPNKFTHKLTDDANEKETTINEVKEFGIYNASKYIRSTVNIDRSSEGITNLTTQKDPIFTNETLFLNVILEGKATLFFFKEDIVEKYFYKKENSTIEQLINKNYLTPNNSIAKNEKYLIQLWNDLKCPDLTMKMIEKIKYTSDDLTNFFTKYNQCNNSQTTIFDKKKSWDLFKLTVRPGINSSSLSIININNANSYTIDFKNQISVRLGIEAEIVLPFNKNKWSIVLEPTYIYYNSKVNYVVNGNSREASVDYKAIEFPLGIRHYFFLNNDSKILINGFLVPEFNFSSTIKFSDNSDVLDIDVSSAFALGIGYKFKNKYSIEYRYTTNKNLLSRYDGKPEAKFMNSSLIFGYTFF